MLENFIMYVRCPEGVSGEREAFVSRAAACYYNDKNFLTFPRGNSWH